MTSFGERLKELRLERGLRQDDIGKILNVGKSTISQWENNVHMPDLESVSKLASYFNVSIDYLLGHSNNRYGLDSVFQVIPNAFPVGKIIKLPIIGVIRAGTPILATENLIGWIEVSEETVKDGEYFFLRVMGDSMKDAHIPDGSLVLIRRQDYVDSGAIAVVLVENEEATVKKVKYFNGKIMLIPANPAYEPQIYNPSEVRIIGKVVEIHINVK